MSTFNAIVNPTTGPLHMIGLGQIGSSPLTPSDSADIAYGADVPLGLVATGAGAVNVQLAGGGTALLQLLANRPVLVAVTRVLATSTTASGLSVLTSSR